MGKDYLALALENPPPNIPETYRNKTPGGKV
jgi:hypothetical protein